MPGRKVTRGEKRERGQEEGGRKPVWQRRFSPSSAGVTGCHPIMAELRRAEPRGRNLEFCSGKTRTDTCLSECYSTVKETSACTVTLL